MGKVTVRISGQAYQLACQDGEENRLLALAAFIDEKMASLAATLGQSGESRLFLMTALVIADELLECREQMAKSAPGNDAAGKIAPVAAPDLIFQLANKIEHIADRLEKA
jgi:cell division protein ZapA